MTVTGSPTKVKLIWGDKVELDPFFVMNHSGATENKSERSVTFTMNPGSEIITFYRAKDAPGNWGDIVVECKAA